MKQELLCITCGRRSIAMFGMRRNFGARDGCRPEFVSHQKGRMTIDKPLYEPTVNGEPVGWKGPCVCDDCGSPIPKGTEVVARAMGHGSTLECDGIDSWFLTMIEVTP